MEGRIHAIYNFPGHYCQAFGGGYDLYIAPNAHQSASSYTNFGKSYELPQGYTFSSAEASEARSLLAGSYFFSPNEVEVFYLDEWT